jgi:two-component sensor histidine kinase
LIYAEKRYAKSKDNAVYQTILEELAVRIHGMALVHTMLSDAEWAPLPLHELAEKIIGSVHVESAPGKGSTFVITLPKERQ